MYERHFLKSLENLKENQQRVVSWKLRGNFQGVGSIHLEKCCDMPTAFTNNISGHPDETSF